MWSLWSLSARVQALSTYRPADTVALTQRWAVSISRPRQPWGHAPVGRSKSTVPSQRMLNKALGSLAGGYDAPTAESQGMAESSNFCANTRGECKGLEVAGFVFLCAYTDWAPRRRTWVSSILSHVFSSRVECLSAKLQLFTALVDVTIWYWKGL